MTTKRAHIRQFKLGESMRNIWHIKLDHDESMEDALLPGYLWHGKDRLAPGDQVEISDQTIENYARLLVVKLDNETQSVLTRVMERFDWTGQALVRSDLADATVEFKGRAEKWCVLLGNVYLSREHLTKEEAQAWLDDQRGDRAEAA